MSTLGSFGVTQMYQMSQPYHVDSRVQPIGPKIVWIQLLNFTPLPFTLVTFVLEQIQIKCQGSMLSFGCLLLIFGGPKRGVQEEDLQSVALAK